VRVETLTRNDTAAESSLGGMIRHAGRVLMTILREIFDEAAYARFLRRTQRVSSAQAYEEFTRERESAQNRRPRCC
jgi:cobyric acid synthase